MQPNIIQNPIVNERLSRFLGIRQANVCPQLAPELMPVVLVDDLRDTARGGKTPTTRRWVARADLPVVANFATIRLHHLQPLNPTTIQRVHRLTLCSSAAVSQQVYVELVSTVSAGIAVPDTQKRWVDGRLEGRPNLDLRVLDAGVAPVTTNQCFEARFQGGQIVQIDFKHPPVLTPFSAATVGLVNTMIISNAVAGTFLSATIEGEEENLIG